jgi:hypothetical protein
MVKSATNPYWLGGGEERCPHCFLLYAVAVQRHCAACDGPTCPHCVILLRETREVLCPQCERAERIEAPSPARAQSDEAGTSAREQADGEAGE